MSFLPLLTLVPAQHSLESLVKHRSFWFLARVLLIHSREEDTTVSKEKKVINIDTYRSQKMSDENKFRSVCSIADQLSSTTRNHIQSTFSALDGLLETIDPKKYKQAKICLEQIFDNLEQIRDNCFTVTVQTGHLQGWDSTKTLDILRRATAKMDALIKAGKEYDPHELRKETIKEVEEAEINA
jgi:hypothetical protein